MAPESREVSGASAEVGVRKIDEDGNVVQEEGYLAKSERRVRGWTILIILSILSVFGLWQILELVGLL